MLIEDRHRPTYVVQDGRGVMLLCATSPFVCGEERLRAPALRVKYTLIGTYASCASFSNPNRMNTLAFLPYLQ